MWSRDPIHQHLYHPYRFQENVLWVVAFGPTNKWSHLIAIHVYRNTRRCSYDFSYPYTYSQKVPQVYISTMCCLEIESPTIGIPHWTIATSYQAPSQSGVWGSMIRTKTKIGVIDRFPLWHIEYWVINTLVSQTASERKIAFFHPFWDLQSSARLYTSIRTSLLLSQDIMALFPMALIPAPATE